MNTYFKRLDDNLYFLDKEKRDEIVNKYRNIVKEDIDSGLSETEALKRIGSVDTIVRKVCKENNLNYNYCKRNNKFDKDLSNVSKLLSDLIKDIIKVFRSTMYGINLETFLVTFIKIFVLFFIYLLLKIPMVLFQEVIYFINKILFYPMNNIFNSTSDIVISIIYLFMCLVMTIKVLGNYIPGNKKIVDKEKISKQVDRDYSWLEYILRIIIYLIIIVPIYLLIFISLLILIFILYLLIKGINIIGIPIILVGTIVLLLTLKIMITDNLKNKIRNYTIYLIASIVIICIGLITSLFNYKNFNYYNELSKSSSKIVKDEVKIELSKLNSKIELFKGNYEIIEDNTLIGTNVKVEVEYYDDYVDIEYYQKEIDGTNYLVLQSKPDSKPRYRKIVSNLIKDLKNKKVFNYGNSRRFKVTVYANKEVKKVLEK